MAGKIRIEKTGDVSINGNLYVAGRVEAEGLTLKTENTPPDNTSGEPGVDTSGADSYPFEIQDASGSAVAAISASGSAEFKNIASGQITIAGASPETQEADINGEIETNAAAGHAKIKAGEKTLTIKSPAITDTTLIYVTPTSDTKNYVLYVKTKEAGSAGIGFNQPLDIDVEFNWWVIKTRI